MATFASQVWNIVELAEMILLHLPLRCLLLSKRVCTWWRQVHHGSEKIKVALFLKSFNNYTVDFEYRNGPKPKHKTHIRDTGVLMQNGNPIFNPFLNVFVHADDVEYNGKVALMSDSFVSGIDAEDEYPLHPAPV